MMNVERCYYKKEQVLSSRFDHDSMPRRSGSSTLSLYGSTSVKYLSHSATYVSSPFLALNQISCCVFGLSMPRVRCVNCDGTHAGFSFEPPPFGIQIYRVVGDALRCGT